MLNPNVTMPLGVLQLEAVLSRRGFPVTDILDMQIYHPGEIRERLEQIVASRPDFVGLSALSQYRDLTQDVARFFKKRLPGVRIILGGPLVSSNPNCLAEMPDADFGISGEGEESLPLLLEALTKGNEPGPIPGLAARTAGGVSHIPAEILSMPLDDLPPVDWGRVDFARYGRFLSMAFLRSPYAAIMTSRGCPFGCIFCHKIFGNRFRTRSVENVMEELHRLHCDHGIRRFEIIDDIFNWERERASEILVRIRNELPDASVSFPNGLRIDRLDEAFVRLLAQVRCEFVLIPVESASPRIQKLIRKNLDLSVVEDVAGWMRKHRVPTVGMFMIGFPTETREEMEQTINLARRLKVDMAAIQTANPYEGTKMREMLGDAAAPADLGDIHGKFAGGDPEMEAVLRLKLKVMRSMMLRPSCA
jgi:anaerobic magnesium-protoporphyrin IX monomethyl ester cyclase